MFDSTHVQNDFIYQTGGSIIEPYWQAFYVSTSLKSEVEGRESQRENQTSDLRVVGVKQQNQGRKLLPAYACN
jgi:hypothetical protein